MRVVLSLLIIHVELPVWYTTDPAIQYHICVTLECGGFKSTRQLTLIRLQAVTYTNYIVLYHTPQHQ